MSRKKVLTTLPCIATRDVIVHPGMALQFEISRKRSLAALEKAVEGDSVIFLTAQKDVTVNDPERSDCYDVGTVCNVVKEKAIVGPNGEEITKVLVVGLFAAKIVDFEKTDECLYATVEELFDKKTKISDFEMETVFRLTKSAFMTYAEAVPRMPDEMKKRIAHAETPQELFEAIAFNVSLPAEGRQELLELRSPYERLSMLIALLSHETEMLNLEKDLHQKVSEAINREQRDYYLREEMRVIKEELGEDDYGGDDTLTYLDKLNSLGMPEDTLTKVVSEVKKLEKMPYGSQEGAVIRTYLDTVIELPWSKKTVDKTDINKVSAQLDKDHFGLKKVKERILEIIAVRQLAPDVKGQIICLAGPPGVGKSSIAKSIAKALGRKYVRVSLGGVKDEADIRGHRKTYIGAMPGRIINAMKIAGSSNPVMLLDEIDKMANDFRGDPASAMLEVLDSEQNREFRDHYLELPYDLSDVLFITTANTLDTIAPPLLDRMDVIELPSYTREEKFEIAKRHLIPKQLKANGLNARMIRFPDAGVYELIDYYTREAGVRTLERTVSSLCRKGAKDIVSGEAKRIVMSPEIIEKYLGPRKFLNDLKSDKAQVGEVNGLAWTAVGGTLMPLEVLSLDGKGVVELTGSLGDVMKESARIAVSYTRSVADRFGIPGDFYQKKDIHVHAPEGAVPKDGPSAGVTLATAIISELSGIPVRADVAMTGEITLRGKVLPIGGLREKTMAAYKAGIKTVIIPAANKPDLEEVDEKIKNSLEFIFAETIDDVLNTALVGKASDDDSKMLTPPDYNKKKSSGRTEVRC